MAALSALRAVWHSRHVPPAVSPKSKGPVLLAGRGDDRNKNPYGADLRRPDARTQVSPVGGDYSGPGVQETARRRDGETATGGNGQGDWRRGKQGSGFSRIPGWCRTYQNETCRRGSPSDPAGTRRIAWRAALRGRRGADAAAPSNAPRPPWRTSGGMGSALEVSYRGIRQPRSSVTWQPHSAVSYAQMRWGSWADVGKRRTMTVLRTPTVTSSVSLVGLLGGTLASPPRRGTIRQSKARALDTGPRPRIAGSRPATNPPLQPSIPGIPFVKLHAVRLAGGPEFLLERPAPVVLFRVRNAPFHGDAGGVTASRRSP